MSRQLKVFAGRSNPALADGICRSLGIEPGNIEFVQFSNENIKVKVCENVRGCDVYFIQTSCPPVNEHLMELLIALDSLKYASAARITAVLPYYPYALSDSKDEPRISVAGRLVADLVAEAGAHRILTMTLHSPQIVGFSRLPMDQLSGVTTICQHFSATDLTGCVAAATDISRAKVTEAYAKQLGLPLVVLDKRTGRDGEAHVHGVIGQVEGREVILLDDEVITGDSMVIGAEALMAKGASRVRAGCVHGSLAPGAMDRIEASVLESLVVTDTIPQDLHGTHDKLTVCSVASHFADAIKAINEETSVSALFN